MKKTKGQFTLLLLALIIITLATFIITVSIGALDIPLEQTLKIVVQQIMNYDFGVNEIYQGIIWQIRIPRVFMAMLVGAGLALCGVVMQAIVQNPLAEPFLLGISSGGYLGAVTFIMLGSFVPAIFGLYGIALFAFIGAVLASFSVIFLSSYKSKITTTKLILSGVIVNAAFQAVANFVVAVSGSYESITRITFWTMGSLNAARWDGFWLPCSAVIASILFFASQYRTLNALLQGDETAITLGVNTNMYRKIYITIISLLVGILVSQCGIIGFVGLVIPHVSRAIIGADHRRLIPVAIFTGAIFLMIADCVARTIISDMELPIGVFTALVGAPFFAYIMIRKNYSFSK